MLLILPILHEPYELRVGRDRGDIIGKVLMLHSSLHLKAKKALLAILIKSCKELARTR